MCKFFQALSEEIKNMISGPFLLQAVQQGNIAKIFLNIECALCVHGIYLRYRAILHFKMPAELDKTEIFLDIASIGGYIGFWFREDPIVDTNTAGLWNFINGKNAFFVESGK